MPGSHSVDRIRSDRGRQSYHDGHSFEERVAELYRLLRYDVEHGRLFSGRQIDIFLKGRFGDLKVFRAIECKIGSVNAQHIDSFIVKLRLVRREYPSIQGTIVSATSFSDAIASQAAQEGIQLTLLRDLTAELFDGHSYVRGLIREFESNDRYLLKLYVEPFMGFEIYGDSSPAFSIVEQWLKDSLWNQLTLLGDVGTGKTFLSRMIAYNLAKSFLENPIENPVPILIDLRNADRQFSLEGLVLTHLAKSGLSQTSFEVFQHALSAGKIVLILDGFDEMASRVTPIVTNRNFHELSRCVKGSSKVLLTCRTHYFKSRTEEEEVILGSGDDYESDTARELYWELISRKGFKIAYLRPFEISQIEDYIERALPKDSKRAIRKIKKTYNLIELSHRAMLLEMIVKSITRLSDSEINPTTLYRVYTDAWIHRDHWRDVLSADEKISFLKSLANSLWQEEVQIIHHKTLEEYLHKDLSAQIQNNQQFLEIDNEIRTASFLTRDEYGNYGFAHKSYLEYFIALYMADQLNTGTTDVLHTKRISPEVITFLSNLVSLNKIEPLLEKNLCSEYKATLSENSLICLYGFRRITAINQQKSDVGKPIDLKVQLPSSVKLNGSKLNQIYLEGAILKNADFREANLSEAIFRKADLSNGIFYGANLEKADFRNCILKSSDMSSTHLIAINLENANLSECNFQNSNLTDAYLINTISENANFDNVISIRAALPDEIRLTVKKRLDEELIVSDFNKSNMSLSEKYWSLIEELRPGMLKSARALSITNNFEAEDLVTDVIIRLLNTQTIEKLLEIENSNGQMAYINRVIRNHAIEKYRSGLKNKLLFFSEIIDPELTGDKFDETLYQKIDLTQIPDINDNDDIESISLTEIEEILPENFWRVIKLRYIEGLKLKEIALIEGKSLSTIHLYIRKALEILRDKFSDGFN